MDEEIRKARESVITLHESARAAITLLSYPAVILDSYLWKEGKFERRWSEYLSHQATRPKHERSGTMEVLIDEKVSIHVQLD